MKDRILLFLVFPAAVVALTFVHRTEVLGLIIAFLCMVSYPHTLRLLGRTLLSVLFFATITTTGYAISQYMRSAPFFDTLLLINTRIVAITFLTTILLHRVDLHRALAVNRTAIFLLILVQSQIRLYQSFAREFTLALNSRSSRRPNVRTRLQLAASIGRAILLTALHEAEEKCYAMESRLYFESNSTA